MKKPLLFATGIAVSGLMTAQVASRVSKIPAHIANITAQKTDKKLGDEIVPSFMTQTAVKNKSIVTNAAARTAAYSSTTVGVTYYDLQTNGSTGNRVVVNADGSISTVWTMDPNTGAAPTYTARGTGYNYFDGSNWLSAPTTRIENVRTGWPEVVNLPSGKEAVISHGISGGKIDFVSRATKGTGTWNNNTTVIPTANAGGNFWPRMVGSGYGDTLYMISLTYPTASGGQVYQGLDGAVVFSRSTDGGQTWGIANVVPTGLTSAEYRGFGGDGYAIAARGPVVAIVAGDSDRDLTMTKSTDGGNTWTATKVHVLPPQLQKWDHTTTTSDYNGDSVNDTLEVNDGSYAIGIDNNNEVYVAFGRMRILQTAVQTTQSWSYFPGTDGLYLWRESYGASTWGNQKGQIVAAIEDLGEKGTIYFPTPSNTSDSPWGTYYCSLTSHPGIAFDASNNLYMSYSSIVDSLSSLPNLEKLVRHVYLVKSCDGGSNWSDPYELDKWTSPTDIPYECVFPSIAKRVNGNVTVLYQRDLGAGYGVPPSSGTGPDAADNDANNTNEIVCAQIPVSDLSCSVVTGIKNNTAVAELSFYPNPARNNATLSISLKEAAKMEVALLNSVGQKVYSTSVSGNAGNNKVEFNLSNLSSGMYFYQVKMDNGKAVTQKFVVE